MRTLEAYAFDTIAAIKSANSVDQIFASLAATASSFGLPHFLVTGVPLPGQKLSQHVLMSGWPTEWFERYSTKDYVHVDPVARKICRSTSPFVWSDLTYDCKKHRMAGDVMSEARAFGMNDGFTVPIYGFDGYQACVTMGGETCELSPDEFNSLHIISLIAHACARELVMTGAGNDEEDGAELSERELDVLKWTSAGKTNWEISVILSISDRTVEKHIGAIISKLNTLNRTHAVAHAIRVGLIN